MFIKKKIIFFLSIVVISLFVFVCCILKRNTADDIHNAEKNMEQSEKTTKVENQVLKNVDIKLYGTDIQFEEDLQYEKVQKIDSSVFESSKKYVYLIINNLDGNLNITDKELQLLKKLMDDNMNYNMIFFGKNLEQLVKVGFLKEIDDKDDYSFGYLMSSGFRRGYRGIWNKEDEEEFPDTLGKPIISTIEHCVKNYDESADDLLSHFFEEE